MANTSSPGQLPHYLVKARIPELITQISKLEGSPAELSAIKETINELIDFAESRAPNLHAELYQDVRNINVTNLPDGSACNVGGRLSVNDGGQGTFYFDSTINTADDDGVILAPFNSVNGRWVRSNYSIALHPEWFGAVLDGVTDDYIPVHKTILSAIALDVYRIIFPTKTCLIASQLTIPDGLRISGESRKKSIIKSGVSNAALFVLGSDTKFDNISIDGDSGSVAGGKIFDIPANSYRNHFCDAEFYNSDGYVVEYLDVTAGSQSYFVDCRVARYNGAVVGREAIKIPDVLYVQAVPRSFENISTDGTRFIDLGGCNNLFVNKGYYGGFKFSDNSRCVRIGEARLADLNGLTIKGANHSITGSDIYGTVTLEVGCNQVSLSGNSFNQATPIVDNSGLGALNTVDGPVVTFVPVITSSGAAVDLGAGSNVRGQYCRSGGNVHVDIEVTFGNAPVVPGGFLEFSIPASIVPKSATIQAPAGSGYTQQGVNTKILTALAFPATAYLKAITEGGGQLTNINPFVWANANVIRLSHTYTL